MGVARRLPVIDADIELGNDRLTCGELDQLGGLTEDGPFLSPCSLASELVELCSAQSPESSPNSSPVWNRGDSYSDYVPTTRCTCDPTLLKLISICATCQGELPRNLRSWESSCGEIGKLGMSRMSGAVADADDITVGSMVQISTSSSRLPTLSDVAPQKTLNRRSSTTDTPAPRKWPALAIAAPIIVFGVLSIAFAVFFFVYRRRKNNERAGLLERLGLIWDTNTKARDSDGLLYDQNYDYNDSNRRRKQVRTKAYEDAKLQSPRTFCCFSTRKKVRPYKHDSIGNWSIDVDIDDQSHGHRSVRASISSLNGVPPQTHAPLPTDSVEHIRLPPIQDASQHVIEKPIRGVQKKKPKPIRVLNTPEDRMEILDGLLSRAESSIAKPTHAPRGPRRQSNSHNPNTTANVDMRTEESWMVVDPNGNTLDSNHTTRDSNSVIVISGTDQNFTISSQSHATTSEGHDNAQQRGSMEVPRSRSPSRSPTNSPSPRAYIDRILPMDRTSPAALVPAAVRAAGYSPGQQNVALPSTNGSQPVASVVLSSRQSVSTSGPPTSSAEYTVPNPFTDRHTRVPSDDTPRQHYRNLASTSGSAGTRPVDLPNSQTGIRPKRDDTVDEYTERNPFVRPSSSPRPPPPPLMSNVDDASTRAVRAESESALTHGTSDAATSSVEYTVPNPFTQRAAKRANPPISRSGMFAAKAQNAVVLPETRQSTHYVNLESYAMSDQDNETSEGVVSSPTGMESIPESAAAPSSNELDPLSSTSDIASSVVRAFPTPPPLSSVIGMLKNNQRGRALGVQTNQTSNSSDYSVPNPYTKRAQIQRQMASENQGVTSTNPFLMGSDVEKTPKRNEASLLE